MRTAFLFLIAASVFFGIGTFVYQRLEMRVSIDSGYWLRGFYHFSLVLRNPQCHRGSDLLYTEWDSRGPTAAILSTFLAHHVKRAAKSIVYQDREAYYLAEEAGKPTLRLEKPECLELTTTFDGAKVFLGERQEFWDFSVIQLFVLNEEPPRLPVHFPKNRE